MITIDNLAFSYGNKPVLNNISLRLETGKIYGLLGENGVGKTTLLTLICGLKKAQSGSIDCDGIDPCSRNPEFLAQVFYLPDEVAPVPSTAISWAKSLGPFWPNFKLENFSAAMKDFEMDETMKMHKMSAGQLKKTYISFALACGTSYILMDEPTNGLDIPSKAQFRSAVLKYTRDDSTIVISTHQVKDLESMIDPIIILDRKDVLLNASVEQINSKLYFDYGNTLRGDALYAEQLPGGFIQVCPNTTGEDSKLNIEALFNAVHNNKELVKAIFNNE
ncbi:MAG: ABC transporter ATP-binding protein [Bacteroidales bacterium]|nr:ABC transporter ATP-binding protein [Bacteroidales bacterium]